LLFSSCNRSSNKNISIFKIDKSITDFVSSKFDHVESEDNWHCEFENFLIGNYYKEDSLVSTYEYNDRKSLNFTSFYYVDEDTIKLNGFFGDNGGYGFIIKFIDEKPEVYHLAAGMFPMYSNTQTGKLRYKLEVPVRSSNLTISEIPRIGGDYIFGVIDFESENYFINNSDEELPIKERTKLRIDLKVYFKSNYFDPSKFNIEMH